MGLQFPEEVVTFHQASAFITKKMEEGYTVVEAPTPGQITYLEKHSIPVPATKAEAAAELARLWNSDSTGATEKQIALIMRLDPGTPKDRLESLTKKGAHVLIDQLKFRARKRRDEVVQY